MSEILQAYRTLQVPPARFLTRYLAPVGAAGIAALVFLQVVVNPRLEPALATATTLLVAGFFAALAALLPVMLRDRRRVLIDHKMHFYITRLGVLSTSKLPRNELLRTLASRREYGPLAEETGRILELVEQWNASLPQACLIVARNTPSKIFADFLERMAHILESSGDLEGFLRREQDVVLKEYASAYQGGLYGVEALKDLYLSLMMSGVFMVIFALVLPPLTGGSAAAIAPSVLLAFVLMEAMLVLVLHFRAPPDRLWTDNDLRTHERLNVVRLAPLAGALAFALLVGLWFLSPLPKTVVVGCAVSPLLLAGLPAGRVEGLIKRREANYPAFLRSLGASVGARGGGANDVLKRLGRNDFGPLTPLIRNLHRRLALRLDEVLAWRHFSAETGSRLINEFNDMYVEATRAGGSPATVGDIISDNFLQLGTLRRARYQSASSMRGMLLGFTAAMGFTLFIGLEVVGVLGRVFASLPAVDVGLPITFGTPPDVEALRLLLLLVVVAHAALCAAIVKIVDGGARLEGCTVLVAVVWIGVAAAEASGWMMGTAFAEAGA